MNPAAVPNPAAMAEMALAAQQNLNRTVYLGNIHPDTTLDELCNTIRGGVLQQIKFIDEKHIAVGIFSEDSSA